MKKRQPEMPSVLKGQGTLKIEINKHVILKDISTSVVK
jgi:hypothetical protein